jgi:Fur family iron response transcriptional regulator
MNKQYHNSYTLLRKVGLRPTKQRLCLANLLFKDFHRHVFAEELFREALQQGVKISLATIYNSLHQFTAAGLLREIAVDSKRCYFDTNLSHHHHFIYEKTSCLVDVPENSVLISQIPPPPEGVKVNRIDVMIRLGES